MDKLVGDFYVKNTTIRLSKEVQNQFDACSYKFYEVLRVIQQKAIFLEDHIDRLKSSLCTLGYKDIGLENRVSENLSLLIGSNRIGEGNIKLLCSPGEKYCDLAAYYIPHSYPDKEDYLNGVNLLSRHIDRPDPNLKQVSVSDSIRHRLTPLVESRNIFDILLIDKKGIITEGSKSNFFLLRQGALYTAPDNLVLKGITRHYVLKIAREFGIKTILMEIPLEQISQFEAAFLCGTSPKILPVRRVDDYSFNTRDLTTQRLAEAYDESIQRYIQSIV